MFTKVKSVNKGIARILTEGVENTYRKICTCPIDFLIDIFKGKPYPYIRNACRHCKKLHTLIDLVHNSNDFEFEEDYEEPTFQVNLMLPPVPDKEVRKITRQEMWEHDLPQLLNRSYEEFNQIRLLELELEEEGED